ncbi:Multisubstrate pseudouridine synthase 7 [Neonectria ditissima]|uniref:Multisubstrate pseudouridine synthase 7 n=1 Tax=Neonectria ditissima TaxID=78410 RepID=A0A0P7BF14_9HYPO|nr:Multisubstrate pseudouridine synthase 7 [Neonectria ditissima]
MAEQPHFTVRGTASYNKTLGITQRATPLTATWTGDLRARFSDFQVNEIQADGSVLHLKKLGLGDEIQSTEVKQEPKAEPAKEEGNQENVQLDAKKEVASNGNNAPAVPVQSEQTRDVSAEDVAALEALTDPQFTKEVVELYKVGSGVAHEKPKKVTSQPVDDRPKRGQIHQEIRRIFKSQIDTGTDDSGAIFATFVPPRKANNKKSRGGRGNRDRREEKPAGEYLHFTLFKENRDTMDAVNQISRFLKIKTQAVGYAGTKDRRASTVQRCSVRHQRSRNLAGLNGRLWGISTGDYEYHDRSVYLGQLLGNEFVIAIKNCEVVGESNDEPVTQRVEKMRANVDSAMAHMAEHGWINYFGHQRFGTHEIGTHQIGTLILGDKYEEAVKSLLHYDEEIAAKAEAGEVPEEASKRDDYARNQACMLFLTGKDIDKAVKIMPRRFSAESCIFRHLNRQGAQSQKDFVGALIHITRGLRSMYLHAYQSYVWNHAASKRWETHGETVVKGDLVIAQTESTPLVSGQDQDGDDIVNPIDDDDDAPVRARPLTADEAASGSFSVYDVVLPTPGYDVVYPDNEMGAFYEEFMGREENGGLDPHKMRRMRREFSLPGRYRKLMNRFLAPPSIEVRAYADDTEQMHPTDLDVIKAASKRGGDGGKRRREDAEAEPTAKKAKEEDNDGVSATVDVAMAEDGSEEAPPTVDDAAVVPSALEPTKIAVIVKFQLGRSAYATVALRDLMGDPPEETSVA